MHLHKLNQCSMHSANRKKYFIKVVKVNVLTPIKIKHFIFKIENLRKNTFNGVVNILTHFSYLVKNNI